MGDLPQPPNRFESVFFICAILFISVVLLLAAHIQYGLF